MAHSERIDRVQAGYQRPQSRVTAGHWRPMDHGVGLAATGIGVYRCHSGPCIGATPPRLRGLDWYHALTLAPEHPHPAKCPLKALLTMTLLVEPGSPTL